MGMMEDLYIKIRDKVNELGKTTGKYVDISKLKIKVAECENDISIKKQKIGNIVFERIQSGDSFDVSDVIDIVGEIKDLMKSKVEYETKINKLKGKCVCGVCKSLNNYDAQYCSSCGNDLSSDDSCKHEQEDDGKSDSTEVN